MTTLEVSKHTTQYMAGVNTFIKDNWCFGVVSPGWEQGNITSWNHVDEIRKTNREQRLPRVDTTRFILVREDYQLLLFLMEHLLTRLLYN